MSTAYLLTAEGHAHFGAASDSSVLSIFSCEISEYDKSGA